MTYNDIFLVNLGTINTYYYLNQLMALDACRPLCED